MSSAARRLLTAEEYARFPSPDDGTKDELIEGVVVKRPLPGVLHGECCVNAGSLLAEYANRRGGVAVTGSDVIVGRKPDSVLGPDVAYWSARPPNLEGWPSSPPAALFEVVDHDEPYHYIHRKVLLYLRFGVGVLWVVAPLCDSVTEYRGGAIRLLTRADRLDGGDVLPGFTCKVAELFG